MSLKYYVFIILWILNIQFCNNHLFAKGDKGWTVIIFMNANNDLVEYAELDIRELMGLSGYENVNVIFQISRYEGQGNCGLPWKGNYRFELHKGEDICPNESFKLKEGLSKKQMLEDLINWTKLKYKPDDNRYLLVLWDHGNKWVKPKNLGFDKYDELITKFYEEYINQLDSLNICSNPRTERYDLSKIFKRKEKDSFESGLSESFSLNTVFASPNQNLLTLGDVQEVIDTGSLDIIAFDACLMGTMETAYSLRDKAKVMIASEELVPGCGWNYNELLKKIMKYPLMDELKLSKEIVSLYKTEYNSFKNVSLSALNLEYYQPLHESLNQLSLDLIKYLEHNDKFVLTAIQKARKKCRSYGRDKYAVASIDLSFFCRNLYNELSSDLRYRSICSELMQIIQLISNDLVYGEFSKHSGQGSKGVAIYFPPLDVHYEELVDEYIEERTNQGVFVVPFILETKWDNFLRIYNEKRKDYL